MSIGADAYALSFQVSPIILTGGVAGNIPGGMLPILAISDALTFAGGLLGDGSDDFTIERAFAAFMPMPGSTLVSQRAGTYTFANQAVAANSIIADALVISMLMMIPVREEGGYAAKLATMTALKATLDQHNNSGGTYTIATPAQYYTDCIMLSLIDVSDRNSKQPQNAYQWSFVKPLVSLTQAQQAQNSAMSKISGGLPTDGSTSGFGQTVGNPQSLAAPSATPSLASGPAGAGVAGLDTTQ